MVDFAQIACAGMGLGHMVARDCCASGCGLPKKPRRTFVVVCSRGCIRGTWSVLMYVSKPARADVN